MLGTTCVAHRTCGSLPFLSGDVSNDTIKRNSNYPDVQFISLLGFGTSWCFKWTKYFLQASFLWLNVLSVLQMLQNWKYNLIPLYRVNEGYALWIFLIAKNTCLFYRVVPSIRKLSSIRPIRKLKFKTGIQNSNSQFKCKISIRNSCSKFMFDIFIQNLNSKSKIKQSKVLLSDSELKFHMRNPKFRLQISIQNVSSTLKY